MISQKEKYALKAIVALARAGEGAVLMIGDIAERESIPKKFLEQILLDLKHQGIVISRRGKTGGYQLLNSANEITFGDILRIIDGPLARVAEAMRQVLDGTTIANCLGREGGTKFLQSPGSETLLFRMAEKSELHDFLYTRLNR
ncbi:Rrf2 family transcriptional regulator [Breoghania sp.]|uniref:RrF2 family transcriptional regulator n=1 Tax=Breoghania sp. TaxID=2065378 RepID=UPI0026317C71|nr:Rrf2 family transcriptional regulator [Breoghania sp.]MDJ0930572.1 Rrf2 family transcriptional regulator [Breoghania sp.]